MNIDKIAELNNEYTRIKKELDKVKAELRASGQENKEEIIAIKDGIISLLRDRITQSCRCIENNGFITQQQITSVTDMYDSYKNLGGNHGLNIIVEKTIRLPIKQ